MSGLLDGRHTVEVQLREAAAGSLGQKKYSNVGDRLPIRGNLQPLSSDEILANGLQNEITRRFSGRTWPGDSTSLVYTDGWEWSPVGEPEHFGMSPRTAHYVVILKRGAKDGAGQ
jgi:hypothetical protein